MCIYDLKQVEPTAQDNQKITVLPKVVPVSCKAVYRRYIVVGALEARIYSEGGIPKRVVYFVVVVYVVCEYKHSGKYDRYLPVLLVVNLT